MLVVGRSLSTRWRRTPRSLSLRGSRRTVRGGELRPEVVEEEVVVELVEIVAGLTTEISGMV